MASISSVRKAEITPENVTNTGKFSFASGSPIIQLQFAASPALLRTSSLRLNGKLTVRTTAGAAQPTNDGTAGAGCHLSPTVGIQSMIENLTLSNSAGTVLESVRSYNRLVAAIHGGTMSLNDHMSDGGNSICDGLDSTSSFLVNTKEVPFSIRLYAGMLMGASAIPLEQIQGLKVAIELSPSSNVLFGSAASTFDYDISEVSLSCDLLTVSSPGGPKGNVLPSTGAFPYKCWSSLYSTIISGDSTLTFNLPQKAVQSITHSFSKSTDQNNAAVDSLALNPLQNAGGAAALKRVDFSKNGVKLAFDHTLDVAAQSAVGLPETQVLTQSIGAFQPFREANHFGNTPIGVGFGSQPTPPFDVGAFIPTSEDAKRSFSIGLNLDKISGVGQAFQGQPYSVRIRSDLTGSQSNAVHTHVLAASVIQYGPQGVMVSS